MELLTKDFLQSEAVKELIQFRCPRFKELPNIGLYMDQVLIIITDTLAVFAATEEEKVITSAMINNYVKQKVVSAPVNKRYNSKHLAYLIVVCIFKKIFSISEICDLISIQISTYSVEEAYDYFCKELENALYYTFEQREKALPDIATKRTLETELIRSAVLSFANKVYIQKLVAYEKEFIMKSEE